MKRRTFFPALAVGSVTACSTAPLAPAGGAIRITGVEVFPIRVNSRGGWVIIRLLTDAGLTGLGDISHSGRGDQAVGKLHEYVELMKGRSVYEIEWLRRRTWPEYAEFRRATSCAFSAIEQAMLDIQGKAAGVPCYELFGGKLHEEIRNYANINRSTDDRTPEGFAKVAQGAVDKGFRAIKMASFDGMPRNGSAAEIETHTQLGIDCIRAVREVLGPDGDLLVDAHSNFDLERGLDLLKRLEPLNLFWLEEVARPYEIFHPIHKAAPMPIAGGEGIFGVEEFHKYIAADLVETVMPDVKYCGGMTELKKISAMAEGAGLMCAPHGPASPIGNMAAAHVCMSLPNFQILEFSHGDAPWRAELTEPPEDLRPGGMLQIPDRPGLGYELNMKTVEARKAD